MSSQWAAAPSGNLRLLQCRILHGIQVGYLLWSGPVHGMQGNLFCSAWNTSSFSFSELAFFYPFFLSAQCGILPVLIYISPKVSPSWLRGLAVPCGGSVGAIWKWLCLAWSNPWFSWPAVPTHTTLTPALSTDVPADNCQPLQLLDMQICKSLRNFTSNT